MSAEAAWATWVLVAVMLAATTPFYFTEHFLPAWARRLLCWTLVLWVAPVAIRAWLTVVAA